MITRAVERDFGLDQAAQGIGECGPRGIENSQMKKAGAARWRWFPARALPCVQANVMMVAACGNEGGFLAVALRQFETQNAAIKIQRALEISDFQMPMTDADAGIDAAKFVRHKDVAILAGKVEAASTLKMESSRLIFLRLEFGQLLFGAGNLRFTATAKREQLLLAAHVCFGRLKFGAFAAGDGSVRG